MAMGLSPELPAAQARRSDAGVARFGDRDAAGLSLAGGMYAAPNDLLALALNVRQDRLRVIIARWRTAGLAESGRIGPGPGWCWGLVSAAQLHRLGSLTAGSEAGLGRSLVCCFVEELKRPVPEFAECREVDHASRVIWVAAVQD
jgi:hypothetical protein